MPVRRLTLCALFVAFIAILAQVAVPLPFSPVPLTGQVIGVLLAAVLLGSRAGVLTIVAYLLLGAAGAPVFSMARGGFYMLTGPTGGYLLGFIPAVFFAGRITEIVKKPSLYRTTTAMLIALVCIYACGGLQLGMIMRYDFNQVALAGIIPFLPLDLLKVGLASLLASQVETTLRLHHLGHLLDNKQ